MAQSRLQSVLEAKTNLVASFAISWAANVYVAPILFGLRMSKTQGFGMVLMFSVLSFIRQYFIRRMFNRLEGRKCS